ncbi:hypothetical protein GCM10027594_13700 [Hymenobacter agri]
MPHTAASHPSSIELSESAGEAESNSVLLVLPWAVPSAAQVPAWRQRVTTGIVRAASVSSTVPASIIVELRVNHTMLATRWCLTATLAAVA